VDTERIHTDAITRADDRALQAMTERVATALCAAGYHGPFGIDAYRHRLPQGGGTVLNPLSEINARFTMDWATAMARDPRTGIALDELHRLSAEPVIEETP
jgi:hypothetical protein